MLIEYTLANPIQFKDVVECVINNEEEHLTKEDLALWNTKIENWFTQQNKWLAVVLTTGFIGVYVLWLAWLWLGNGSKLQIWSLPLALLYVNLQNNFSIQSEV